MARTHWILPLCAIAGWLTMQPEQVIIYNRTPSVPVGFYIRDSHQLEFGSFVTVSAAVVAADYARQRGYADQTDRFIKRVAAVTGDLVCAHRNRVEVGQAIVLARYSHDSLGRALPAWSECRLLKPGEVFLVGDTEDSFDSRYWGPVLSSQIHGVWRPFLLSRREDNTGLVLR